MFLTKSDNLHHSVDFFLLQTLLCHLRPRAMSIVPKLLSLTCWPLLLNDTQGASLILIDCLFLVHFSFKFYWKQLTFLCKDFLLCSYMIERICKGHAWFLRCVSFENLVPNSQLGFPSVVGGSHLLTQVVIFLRSLFDDCILEIFSVLLGWAKVWLSPLFQKVCLMHQHWAWPLAVPGLLMILIILALLLCLEGERSLMALGNGPHGL